MVRTVIDAIGEVVCPLFPPPCFHTCTRHAGRIEVFNVRLGRDSAATRSSASNCATRAEGRNPRRRPCRNWRSSPDGTSARWRRPPPRWTRSSKRPASTPVRRLAPPLMRPPTGRSGSHVPRRGSVLDGKGNGLARRVFPRRLHGGTAAPRRRSHPPRRVAPRGARAAPGRPHHRRGHRAGASDIHIEPYETRCRVRYRLDGVLHEAGPIDPARRAEVTARRRCPNPCGRSPSS